LQQHGHYSGKIIEAEQDDLASRRNLIIKHNGRTEIRQVLECASPLALCEMSIHVKDVLQLQK
jgi:hypothetical protein